MVIREHIQNLADQIGVNFPDVRTIILFGSHAYGEPTADSDVDFLVVMDHSGAGYRAAARIRATVDVDFPVDFVVRSPTEISNRLHQGDVFIKQILSEGKVLYEAEHGRMDREGGSGFRRGRRASPLP